MSVVVYEANKILSRNALKKKPTTEMDILKQALILSCNLEQNWLKFKQRLD